MAQMISEEQIRAALKTLEDAGLIKPGNEGKTTEFVEQEEPTLAGLQEQITELTKTVRTLRRDHNDLLEAHNETVEHLESKSKIATPKKGSDPEQAQKQKPKDQKKKWYQGLMEEL